MDKRRLTHCLLVALQRITSLIREKLESLQICRKGSHYHSCLWSVSQRRHLQSRLSKELHFLDGSSQQVLASVVSQNLIIDFFALYDAIIAPPLITNCSTLNLLLIPLYGLSLSQVANVRIIQQHEPRNTFCASLSSFYPNRLPSESVPRILVTLLLVGFSAIRTRSSGPFVCDWNVSDVTSDKHSQRRRYWRYSLLRQWWRRHG